ncbi:MAG TPA: hypothetical protein VF320_03960, partial [Acidimicrobiales bacterium]
AVEALLPNLFPPGTDPNLIWLPPMPRPHSPDGDEAHYLRYWQVHIWKTLLRYRRAYAHPVCTERLRAGYPEVEEVAVQLAGRVASGYALNPIDSVGCHSALRDLEAGATALESTIAALAGGSDTSHPVPAGAPPTIDVADATAPESSATEVVPAGPKARDLFISSLSTPWYRFRLGRHGGGGPPDRHAASVRASNVEPRGDP